MNDFKSLVWYYFCKYFLSTLSDKHFANFILFINAVRFKTVKYENINLERPTLFHEKISFLKFNYNNDLIKSIADKIQVRDYVSETIGSKYLIPLLGIYNNADEINFEKLPKEFVLKTNHGSSWNVICDNKDVLNLKKTRKKLNSWLKKNPYFLSRESQYRKNPKILCENFLGDSLVDYKVYCFEGIPKIIQMDFDRFDAHKRCFFDTNWVYQDFGMLYDKPEFKIARPALLSKMIKLCQKLAKDLFFSRIDMYMIKDKIYFGEITFFPEGGNCVVHPKKMDKMMSQWINIKNLKKYK